MQVGITSTMQLKRQQYLVDTVTAFKDLGYTVDVNYDDGTKTIWGNKAECVINIGTKALINNEGFIFCEDDIKISNMFNDGIKTLSDDYLFYCLFTLGGKTLERETDKGNYKWNGILRIYEHKDLYGEVCIYVPKNNVEQYIYIYKDFVRKTPRLREKDKKRQRHPDLMFVDYMRKIRDIKFGVVAPCLVQHVGMVSAVGNKITDEYTSKMFIDDLYSKNIFKGKLELEL